MINKIKKVIIAQIMLLCLVVAANSQVLLKDGELNPDDFQGLKELSLDQAIDLAIKNNLGLKGSSIDLQKTKWSVISLFNTYYPTLSLSGSIISSIKNEDDRKASALAAVPASKTAYGTFEQVVYGEYTTPQWNAALSFNLQWNFNAAMILDSYNKVLEYQSGKITYEDAVASLKKSVKSFYYQIALQKANFEINKRSLESKKDRYEQAQVKFKNGLTPKLDVLSTRVDYESYKPTLQSTGNTIVYLQNMLQFYIGEPLDHHVVLTDTFVLDEKIVPDLKYSFDLFEKNNLTLKTMYLGKKQAVNARNMSIAQLTPSLSIGLGIMPTVSDATKGWFDDGNWADRGNGLTLSVSLPLSNWLPLSSTQVNIIGANYALKKLDYNIENYIKSQRVQIQKSIDDIRTAVENIKTSQMSVELAEESFNETKKAYNLGTKDILAVKDAENTLLTVQYQLQATEYSYRNSLLELEYLLNTDLDVILQKDKNQSEENKEQAANAEPAK